MPGRVAVETNMTKNQNQRPNEIRNPAVNSSKKREERAMREAFRKEHKIESYLADDENFPVFSIQLKKMGLQLRDIPGDGNCLFRALGDQLEGHSRNHYKHRLDVVRYMQENRVDFEPFIEDDVPFLVHIQNLKKLGTYAGNDAIVAFARLHSVNIVIHQLDAKHLMIQGSSNPKVRQLHIAYHNGDHYSSVRKASDNTESPANIRLQDEVKVSEDCPAKTTGQLNGYANHQLAVVRAVRGYEDIEEEVMNATQCKDTNKVREVLLDCDYDVDLAISHMLQVMEITDGSDDTLSLASQRTSTDSGVWSDGTVGRNSCKKVHFREDSYGGSSGYGSMTSDRGGARPKLPQHQYSARKTKELRKVEKKKRAEDRHRRKVLVYQPVRIPSEDESSVVTVISRASSITRI
ncbi:OTU domain-containing protein 3-like [Gigantopelta aegis]|uniref:OTU domain-containing protein 3-like n=1 Tax=Gigantopelta aegis TaxID=1735272 RepID=UPI001B88C495|nr:OTU domain-containing protein 3-like [Gigantopelta aegis]